MALQIQHEDRYGNIHNQSYCVINSHIWTRDGNNKRYMANVFIYANKAARDNGKDPIDCKTILIDDIARETKLVETVTEKEVPLAEGEKIEVPEGMPKPTTKIEYTTTTKEEVVQEGTAAEVAKCADMLTFFYGKVKATDKFKDSLDV